MTTPIARTLVLLFLTATALPAQEPQLINYQGAVTVNGVNFDGSGLFKFAIVDATGSTSYWSNDGTSTAGSEPAAAVTLTVTAGVYSVLLGDTTLPNMAAIPAGAFSSSDVFLSVWFNDGANGSQLLRPDQRLRLECETTTGDVWQERSEGVLPGGRELHTAVWTGSELIIWGGHTGSAFNTGGRYNPAGNVWTAVTTTGAPDARAGHTAVWTGSEMIVWGGTDTKTINFSTGGRYNPSGNSWTAVTNTGAPTARFAHTAVWTGSEMIVWGGYDGDRLNTGGRYNPLGNSWTAVTTTGAPDARSEHPAVWTGSEMIVWGGEGNGFYPGGGRYDPAGDRWEPMSTAGAPSPRRDHTMVWTGSELLVWGGCVNNAGCRYLNNGGRYNPVGNNWTAVTPAGAPAGRERHTAVWTGSEMIVWGGVGAAGLVSRNDGGRYSPAGNVWTAVTTIGAPAARYRHTAVWTGSEMIVWGGRTSSSYLNDTFSYNPGCEILRITSAVLSSGTLTLSFPTMTGRTYTLWRSDTLADATWTNTGLAPVAGTGATLTFTVPATAPLNRFFRVHAGP